MSLTPGSTVGRYPIHHLLGSGGMGEVYKAADSVLGRAVAIKVLRPELSGDPARLSRFLHEARAASALNHPNILTDAMALRSLDDPDLLRLSGFLITIVVVVAAAGAWGTGRRLFQKSPALHPPAKLGIDRG